MNIRSKNICLKLETALNNHDTYEALQLLKSLFFRSKHASQELICDRFIYGLECFTKSSSDDNSTCSLDLCKAFVTYLSNIDEFNQISEVMVQAIAQSVELMRNFPIERNDYILLLNKFFSTRKQLKCEWNDKLFDIHDLLGVLFQKENAHDEAFFHFIRSNNMLKCTDYVYNLYRNDGYPSEFDIFVALPVLQLLALKKINYAEYFFDVMLKLHDESDVSFTDRCDIMFNFLSLLIHISKIQPRNAKNFRLLVRGYKNVYAIEPSLDYFVNLIGKNLFNCTDITSAEDGHISENFLMNVMRNFLSPTEEDSTTDDVAVADNTIGTGTTDNNIQ